MSSGQKTYLSSELNLRVTPVTGDLNKVDGKTLRMIGINYFSSESTRNTDIVHFGKPEGLSIGLLNVTSV